MTGDIEGRIITRYRVDELAQAAANPAERARAFRRSGGPTGCLTIWCLSRGRDRSHQRRLCGCIPSEGAQHPGIVNQVVAP